MSLRLRGYYPLWRLFPEVFDFALTVPICSQNTTSTPIFRKGNSVWPVPVSLAVTPGITIVFFSWRYLDVSVPAVPRQYWLPQVISLWSDVRFGDLRIVGCMRLPAEFRRLPRPSSAPQPSHPLHGVGIVEVTLGIGFRLLGEFLFTADLMSAGR